MDHRHDTLNGAPISAAVSSPSINEPGQRPLSTSPRVHDSRQGTGGDTNGQFPCSAIDATVHDYTFNWPGERGSRSRPVNFADDWRISRKLTLNLGLRWDYSALQRGCNRWANFNVTTGKIDIAGVKRRDKYAGVKPYPYKNWDLASVLPTNYDAQPSCRGGFGMFYNPGGNEGSSLRLFRQLPSA